MPKKNVCLHVFVILMLPFLFLILTDVWTHNFGQIYHCKVT